MADLARRTQNLGQRPALVLVDVIQGFTDPESPLGSEASAVVGACRDVLQAFRVRKLPVCFTTVIYDDDDQASVFRARLPALNILIRGSTAVAVHPELAPMPDEYVVEKHFASAFFQTKLASWLTEQGADSLVVTGLTTSGCVRATVVDGLQHGYCVWVPREAVGDRNAEAHAANLHDLHAKYAEVVGLDEAMAALGAAA